MTDDGAHFPWFDRPLYRAYISQGHPPTGVPHLYALRRLGRLIDFRYHNWWVASTFKRYVLLHTVLKFLRLAKYIGPWKKGSKFYLGD